MSLKRTNMLMRIVEMAWLAVSAVCVVEIYASWQSQGTPNLIFVGVLVVAVFMFFFRKKQRINYIRRNQHKD